MLYHLAFRIYYAPAAAPSEVVVAQSELGEIAYLTSTAAANSQYVDYLLVGRSVDWSGRGTQRRKHWQTHRGEPHHTLGRGDDAERAFVVRWNTSWLPDQEAFGVQARVLGADGKYRVTPVLNGLRLAPRPYRVSLYNPGPGPRNWVTRSGTFEQTIVVPQAVDDVTAYRLHWTSWSPCYGNGLYLNGHLVWMRNDDCYVYATHAPEFSGHALPYLQTGNNVVATGLTPLMRGKMVHGMEVQWPGVQLLVRRE